MPGALTRMAGTLATPAERRAAWADLLLADHGFIRSLYLNRHEVAPGVWRSAQPSPGHLAAMAAQGLKSVINLRGRRACGSYLLEVDACRRLGLELIDLPLESRGPPHKDRILRLAEVFERAPKGLLLHCKSGADRAGIGAALYLLLAEHQPVAEAQRQLSLRYGHVRSARTGVLDATLEAFAHSGERDFLAWSQSDRYDPEAIKANFQAGRTASALVDRVLRRE